MSAYLQPIDIFPILHKLIDSSCMPDRTTLQIISLGNSALNIPFKQRIVMQFLRKNNMILEIGLMFDYKAIHLMFRFRIF